MGASRKPSKVTKVAREPTPAEAQAIGAAAQRARPARPAMDVDLTEGVARLSSPHADVAGNLTLIRDALGTGSETFTDRALLHLARTTSDNGRPSSESLGAALALIAAIAPENELEAAMALQMAAAHDLSLSLADKAKTAQVRPALNDCANLMNKTMRTFAAQVEALAKLRRGGEQVVRHVHVYEGGQAVVAEQVVVGTRADGNSSDQPHAASAALPSPDPFRRALPIACDQGQEAVPHARGHVTRRAEGEPEQLATRPLFSGGEGSPA